MFKLFNFQSANSLNSLPFYSVEILAGLEMSNYKTKGMIIFEAHAASIINIYHKCNEHYIFYNGMVYVDVCC